MARVNLVNQATLKALKSLTNTELDTMSVQRMKLMLKELRPLGLNRLRSEEIDALNHSEASIMLAEARHIAQVSCNS